MATIGQIVEDAFNDIEVKSSETALSTTEMAQGIRYLNRLMVSFASSGLNLGYSKATSETETFTSPDWCEDMVVTHLAIRLAPGFGVSITPALAIAAAEMMKVVEKRLVILGEVDYPNILPIGSGNWNGNNNSHFFNVDDDTDLLGGNGQNVGDGEEVDLSID